MYMYQQANSIMLDSQMYMYMYMYQQANSIMVDSQMCMYSVVDDRTCTVDDRTCTVDDRTCTCTVDTSKKLSYALK